VGGWGITGSSDGAEIVKDLLREYKNDSNHRERCGKSDIQGREMPRFRIETKLPSTRVTREFVKSLEHFISRRVDGLMDENDDRNEIASALKITITDALGSETMQTIDHFVPTKFPDTTKSIEFSFSGPCNSALKGLELEMQFHKDRQFSRVRVSCENSNPRDLARGMVAGIHECLAPHPAHNAWLHPHPLIDGILIGLAIAIIWVLPFALDHAPLGVVVALATVLVFTYVLPLAIASPQAVHRI
jgi:hypothetical protein